MPPGQANIAGGPSATDQLQTSYPLTQAGQRVIGAMPESEPAAQIGPEVKLLRETITKHNRRSKWEVI